MKSYKQVILSNGKDTVMLREEPNKKGNLVIISVCNGRRREHNCTTLDTELDAYCFSNLKIVDEMTYEK